MIEYVSYKDRTLAIIIRSTYSSEGIEFFTPPDFSQQLAYMKRSKNYCIPPHTHNSIPRQVVHTQEVLFIKSGKVRIDIYDDQKEYLHSRTLGQGDIILLAGGGHGLTMLEKSEIIEVKQGPYAGDDDKTRFEAIPENQIENR